LFLIPALAGSVAFVLPGERSRRGLFITVSVAHTALTVFLWTSRPVPGPESWVGADALSLVFLGVMDLLFLAVSLHKTPVHSQTADKAAPGVPSREGVFSACLLFFLATMSLVSVSRHFGLLWVAVEATTLASAPLIHYHRNARSLEATWKYLLVCSVGIALALLGNFFLAVAASAEPGTSIHLTIGALGEHAAALDPQWLKAAFILFLVGYGTKMGLAPLHTWLPDAHSEAPSAVSALLSGTLLNCAFIGLLRAQAVLDAAGLGAFGRELLALFGLFSMGVAAVFLLVQTDYKRMLAYSSIEHMGVLTFGAGIGGAAVFGAFFHALNHSMIKAALFLLAGNILAAYRTKQAHDARGLLSALPSTGPLWLAGALAVAGFPPFGLFMSEWIILKEALDSGAGWEALAFLVFLALAFLGIGRMVLGMVYHPGNQGDTPGRREAWWSVVPAAALLCGALVLGLWMPGFLRDILADAAALAGGW
jgi:hydrogenase-4 component F